MNSAKSIARLGDIAIIGIAGRFPGADNVDQFWQNLKTGVESVSFFSDQELEGSGVTVTVKVSVRVPLVGAE